MTLDLEAGRGRKSRRVYNEETDEYGVKCDTHQDCPYLFAQNHALKHIGAESNLVPNLNELPSIGNAGQRLRRLICACYRLWSSADLKNEENAMKSKQGLSGRGRPRIKPIVRLMNRGDGRRSSMKVKQKEGVLKKVTMTTIKEMLRT